MTYKIRPAQNQDATQIIDIYLAARATFIPYAPLAHSEAEIASYFSGMLIPDGGVSVIENEDNVLGFIATTDIGGIRWIDQCYLAPAVTGIGIGSQLLRHALATLQPPVRLYCFQQNDYARGFYRRHGFTEIAFGDGSDNEENTADVLLEWRGAPKPAN